MPEGSLGMGRAEASAAPEPLMEKDGLHRVFGERRVEEALTRSRRGAFSHAVALGAGFALGGWRSRQMTEAENLRKRYGN